MTEEQITAATEAIAKSPALRDIARAAVAAVEPKPKPAALFDLNASGTMADGVVGRKLKDPGTFNLEWSEKGAKRQTVEDSPTRPGRKALRFEVPAANQRVEVEPAIQDFKEGDEFWFRFQGSLAASFPAKSTKWQVIQQWKNRAVGSPPLHLSIFDGKFQLTGGYDYPGVPRGAKRFVRDIGAAEPGKPFDFLTRVKFSSDPKIGSVDVTLNGQPKIVGYKPPGGTLYPGQVSYLKQGLYRDPTITEPGVVFLDDLIVGASQASVL